MRARRASNNCGSVAVADQRLGIDHQPAPFAEIDDVVVVYVAVQRHDFDLRRKQFLGDLQRLTERLAIFLRRRKQIGEPRLKFY